MRSTGLRLVMSLFLSSFLLPASASAQDIQTEAALLALELEGISLGFTNHSLDTFSDITNGLENDTSAGFTQLYTNLTRHEKWRGPYVQYTSDQHPQYGLFSLFVSDNDSLWFPDAPQTDVRKDVFIRLTDVPCAIARATFAHLQESHPDTLLLRYNECQNNNPTTISYHLGKYAFSQ